MPQPKRQFLQVHYDIFQLIGEYIIDKEKIKIDYLDCLIIERILDFQNHNMQCYTTNEQLANMFNSSIRTIARRIANLIKLKIIISSVTKSSTNGKNSNIRNMVINYAAVGACRNNRDLDKYYGNI